MSIYTWIFGVLAVGTILYCLIRRLWVSASILACMIGPGLFNALHPGTFTQELQYAAWTIAAVLIVFEVYQNYDRYERKRR